MLEIKYITSILLILIFSGCATRIESGNAPLVELVTTESESISEEVYPVGMIEGVEIKISEFKGYRFLNLRKLDNSNQLIGLLCWSIEASRDELPVIVSNDMGKTWKLVSCIAKDHYMDDFEYCKFWDSGEGIVVLSQDQVTFGIDDAPRKIFVFRSLDFYKTWNRCLVPIE